VTQQELIIQTFETLRDMGWPLKNIRKALDELDETRLKEVAKKNGVDVQTMYATMNGHRRNPAAMAAYSRHRGIPGNELFPNSENGGRWGHDERIPRAA
jgi:DNA-binding transcriptional MerR regulator